MKDSFLLTWRALVRGHVLTALLAATGFFYVALPALVRGDGTAAGFREMFVRVVTGGASTVVLFTVLLYACGILARERADFRLALAVVRPASAFCVALGRWGALVLLAALALSLNGLLAQFFPRGQTARPCREAYVPQLPSVEEAAYAQLEAYLADPKTPDEVRKAPRSEVLTLLANKEMDRFDVVPSGGTASWSFPADVLDTSSPRAIRIRFTTQYDMRTPVTGVFSLGAMSAVVSNSTLSVLEVPLVASAAGSVPETASATLMFRNTGRESLMLRPRRDLEVLVQADSYAANTARALLQVLCTAGVLAAFGLFLSAALSRPVAIFTALVAVVVVLMAPSVTAQFPYELGTPWSKRCCLALMRFIQMISAPADASPVSDLAQDYAVSASALGRMVLVNLVAAPCALLALSAVIIRRKPLA